MTAFSQSVVNESRRRQTIVSVASEASYSLWRKRCWLESPAARRPATLQLSDADSIDRQALRMNGTPIEFLVERMGARP